MDVSEAVDSRLSVREFLKDPVDDQLIKELLEKSARSASGGNLQPWKVYVINNETMDSYTAVSPCGWYLPMTSPTTLADFLFGLL